MEIKNKTKNDSKKCTVKKVIDYIESNLEKEIDLDKISKNAGYSKYHLNRIFKEETGCTIHKYLQRRRLSVAAKKLVKTDKSITQIAYEAGYDSTQAFSYAFKQFYLSSPKTYRKLGVFIPKQSIMSMNMNYYPNADCITNVNRRANINCAVNMSCKTININEVIAA